jgi:hypothetical protein
MFDSFQLLILSVALLAVPLLGDPPKPVDKIDLNPPNARNAAPVKIRLSPADNIKLLYLYYNLEIYKRSRDAECDATQTNKDAALCDELKKKTESWEGRWAAFQKHLESIYHGVEIMVDDTGVATVK